MGKSIRCRGMERLWRSYTCDHVPLELGPVTGGSCYGGGAGGVGQTSSQIFIITAPMNMRLDEYEMRGLYTLNLDSRAMLNSPHNFESVIHFSSD